MNTTTSKSTEEARSLQAVDRPLAGTEREQKEWWAVVEGGVQRVTGYTCAPMNPGYWWCPKVRLSMSEGIHLFVTEAEAIDAAVAEAEREVVKRKQDIELLRAKRPIKHICE